MFRQIIVPSSNNLMLKIPDEFVGHQVEIIAFTVENQESATEKISFDERNARLMKFISNNPIILPEDYKFNRDELYE